MPLIFFVILSGCSKQLDSSSIRMSEGLAYIKESGLLLTGRVIEFAEDGSINTVGHYKRGLKNGLFSYYHPNKRLRKKENYLFGKREGMFLTFHENGRLKSKVFFKDDVPTSELTLYNLNGKPKMVLPYNAESIVD